MDGELKRLNRECFLNNYEGRFAINFKQVLSTIVGTEVVERKLGYLNKQRKKLTEKIVKGKTFAFSNKI